MMQKIKIGDKDGEKNSATEAKFVLQAELKNFMKENLKT